MINLNAYFDTISDLENECDKLSKSIENNYNYIADYESDNEWLLPILSRNTGYNLCVIERIKESLDMLLKMFGATKLTVTEMTE